MLIPAELSFTGNGTPYSAAYDDVYHSAQGGLRQAHHVFLGGNDLPERWINNQSPDPFVILETGFGLGVNFLTTWQAWRAANRSGHLHVISVEKHPFSRSDLRRYWEKSTALHELEPLISALLRQWPPLTPGFHRLHFEANRVTLTLLFGDAIHLLPRLSAKADALYLDGFAPARNPDLWSPGLFALLKQLCKDDATLATWSVAGEVRRTLEDTGWTLERQPGFGEKREMLRGRRAAPTKRKPTTPKPARPQHAIVIGAGLAGSAISARLASRGWHIDLFDRRPGPAQEGSGNPSGIVLPLLTRDDAPAARFSRAAYLYVLRTLAELSGVNWSPCGVLQLARDPAHGEVQQASITELGLDPEFVSFLDQTAASALTGQSVTHGGWWFPRGGWVDPASFCSALLASGGSRIHARYNSEIASLQHSQDGWRVSNTSGHVLAEAPHIILANAYDANRLLDHPLPLTVIRGQISYLPESTVPRLRHVICRSGYLTPAHAGIISLGASFDRDDADLSERLDDHKGNLERLDELIPGAARGIQADDLTGRVGLRTATSDRLPLIGTLPDADTPCIGEAQLDTLPRLTGLHALLGLGARGLIWAPLAAELLASQLNGDPLPIERDLVVAVDPARFHLRSVRRTVQASRQG